MRKPVRAQPTVRASETPPGVTVAADSPPTTPAPIRDWRRDEVSRLQLRQLTSELLSRGVAKDRIPTALRQVENGAFRDITDGEASAIYSAVLRDWREDYSREVTYHRVAQVRRLMNDLVRMRSQPKVPWSSVGRHEELLSEITGTKREMRVSIVDAREDVKDALANVIGNMSEDEIDSFIEAEGIDLGDTSRELSDGAHS